MATSAVTPDNDAVVAEVFIAAPPERVFQAITDPKQMPLWWGQQGLYRVTDWKAELRPGGKWQSDGVGADGTSFRVEGEYLEVDPPRLLVHTWIASYSGAMKTVVRWELSATKAGSRVKVTHSGLAVQPIARKDYVGGWPGLLELLRKYCE